MSVGCELLSLRLPTQRVVTQHWWQNYKNKNKRNGNQQDTKYEFRIVFLWGRIFHFCVNEIYVLLLFITLIILPCNFIFLFWFNTRLFFRIKRQIVQRFRLLIGFYRRINIHWWKSAWGRKKTFSPLYERNKTSFLKVHTIIIILSITSLESCTVQNMFLVKVIQI